MSAMEPQAATEAEGHQIPWWLIGTGSGGLLAILIIVIVVVSGLAIFGATQSETTITEETSYGVSPEGRAEIPAQYLTLYQQAAGRYKLDWAILAGIGKVECDHGQDPDPSCTKEGAENSAGAGGPMQFIGSTWETYGVTPTGHGKPDRWNPADAIYSAANYLRASGAPGDYYKAIYAYNHADWYVREVEHWASVYRGSGTTTVARVSTGSTGPIQTVGGDRAVLSPKNGHIALVPTGAPLAVQRMIEGGNELQDLPYGPGGHPDPVGAVEQDCSSTVNYVLYWGGVRPLPEIIKDNPLAQDYTKWGEPGPGRWVTIYSTASSPAHVFIVIAGLRLDTSHNGTDVGPNRNEDGPRWRILDHIPTWAEWSVRHPRGL